MVRKIAVMVALAACGAFAGDDVVRPKAGAELKGKITRLDLDGVSIDAGGQTKTFKPDEIASFQLGDVPKDQTKAEGLMSSRDFKGAVAAYQSAYADAKGGRGELHKPFILLGLARAQRASGKLDDAIETVLKSLKECPKAWAYVETAREGLDIAAQKKDDAKAKEILGAMQGAPEPMKGYGAIEKAKQQLAARDPAGAAATLAAPASNAAQPYANEAKVWLIRAMRGKKDVAGLEAQCKGIATAKSAGPGGTPPALLQAAWAGLGDALYAKGKSGDKAALHEATGAYAQAIAIGPPSKEAGVDDYADALLNIARCYTLLGKNVGKPEAVDNAKSRSIQYLAELVQRFSGTEWATEGEKELKALGVGGGEGGEKQ